MKKLLIIFGMFIAGSPFVSCKKMKDDIKDLKNQTSELQNQNDSLKNRITGIENLIGSDEPVTVKTSFEDDNGTNRSYTATYKFKSSDYYTQSMIDNNDGTYDIYIERFSDVRYREYASVGFTYNPTTKAVSYVYADHSWDDANYDYSDYVWYGSGTYAGLTKTLTVESFDMATGLISIKFNASGNGTYTSNNGDSPNPGKPVSTEFAFTGKLKLFKSN